MSANKNPHRLPWKVCQFINGEPYIDDCDGYTVTQVVSSIRYPDDRTGLYGVRNRTLAEFIVAAANASGTAQPAQDESEGKHA